MNEEKLPGGQPGGEDPGTPHDAQHSGPLEPTHSPIYRGEDSEELRRRRRRRNIFIVILLLVVLALAFIYFHTKPSTSGTQPTGAAGAKGSAHRRRSHHDRPI